MAFNVRIQHRRDTSANWTSNDPVLLNGEIIIVDTSEGEVRYKIGDGVKKYTELPFDDEVVRNLVNSKVSEHDDDPNSHDDIRNEVVELRSILSPTEEDNDKFLRVVDGVATWVTVPNAEEEAY